MLKRFLISLFPELAKLDEPDTIAPEWIAGVVESIESQLQSGLGDTLRSLIDADGAADKTLFLQAINAFTRGLSDGISGVAAPESQAASDLDSVENVLNDILDALRTNDLDPRELLGTLIQQKDDAITRAIQMLATASEQQQPEFVRDESGLVDGEQAPQPVNVQVDVEAPKIPTPPPADVTVSVEVPPPPSADDHSTEVSPAPAPEVPDVNIEVSAPVPPQVHIDAPEVPEPLVDIDVPVIPAPVVNIAIPEPPPPNVTVSTAPVLVMPDQPAGTDAPDVNVAVTVAAPTIPEPPAPGETAVTLVAPDPPEAPEQPAPEPADNAKPETPTITESDIRGLYDQLTEIRSSTELGFVSWRNVMLAIERIATGKPISEPAAQRASEGLDSARRKVAHNTTDAAQRREMLSLIDRIQSVVTGDLRRVQDEETKENTEAPARDGSQLWGYLFGASRPEPAEHDTEDSANAPESLWQRIGRLFEGRDTQEVDADGEEIGREFVEGAQASGLSRLIAAPVQMAERAAAMAHAATMDAIDKLQGASADGSAEKKLTTIGGKIAKFAMGGRRAAGGVGGAKAASRAGGLLARAAVALGPFALAVGGFVLALGAGAIAMKFFAGKAEKAAQRLLQQAAGMRDVNAPIAGALLQYELDDIRRRMARGNATEVAVAESVNLASELQDAMEPMRQATINLSTTVSNAGIWVVTKVLEGINTIVEPLLKLVGLAEEKEEVDPDLVGAAFHRALLDQQFENSNRGRKNINI